MFQDLLSTMKGHGETRQRKGSFSFFFAFLNFNLGITAIYTTLFFLPQCSLTPPRGHFNPSTPTLKIQRGDNSLRGNWRNLSTSSPKEDIFPGRS